MGRKLLVAFIAVGCLGCAGIALSMGTTWYLLSSQSVNIRGKDLGESLRSEQGPDSLAAGLQAVTAKAQGPDESQPTRQVAAVAPASADPLASYLAQLEQGPDNALRAVSQGLSEFRSRPDYQRILVEKAMHIEGRDSELNELARNELGAAEPVQPLAEQAEPSPDELKLRQQRTDLVAELHQLFLTTSTDAQAALSVTIESLTRHSEPGLRRELQRRFLKAFPQASRDFAAALARSSIPLEAPRPDARDSQLPPQEGDQPNEAAK